MEGNLAKDTFGGRLTPDFVAEKLGHSNFHDVRELDLPNCSIRIVDLGIGDTFLNLRRWADDGRRFMFIYCQKITFNFVNTVLLLYCKYIIHSVKNKIKTFFLEAVNNK